MASRHHVWVPRGHLSIEMLSRCGKDTCLFRGTDDAEWSVRYDALCKVSLITKTFQATHCFDHIAFPQRL